MVLILTRGHPEALPDLSFTPGDLWAAAGMLVFVGYTIAMRRAPASLTPMPQFAVMSSRRDARHAPFAAGEIAAAGLPRAR